MISDKDHVIRQVSEYLQEPDIKDALKNRDLNKVYIYRSHSIPNFYLTWFFMTQLKVDLERGILGGLTEIPRGFMDGNLNESFGDDSMLIPNFIAIPANIKRIHSGAFTFLSRTKTVVFKAENCKLDVVSFYDCPNLQDVRPLYIAEQNPEVFYKCPLINKV